MTQIRPAMPADIPLIRALIQELADYEREPHSVQITEQQLLEDGFGKQRYYECLIAEQNGAPAGFALFFPIYSTWRGYARLQWDVLEWNTTAIDFYRSLDATMLDEWRRMRVTDEALSALATAKPIEAQA
jgi:hypothetical protein